MRTTIDNSYYSLYLYLNVEHFTIDYAKWFTFSEAKKQIMRFSPCVEGFRVLFFFFFLTKIKMMMPYLQALSN